MTVTHSLGYPHVHEIGGLMRFAYALQPEISRHPILSECQRSDFACGRELSGVDKSNGLLRHVAGQS